LFSAEQLQASNLQPQNLELQEMMDKIRSKYKALSAQLGIHFKNTSQESMAF
jgi:hypothetical protein